MRDWLVEVGFRSAGMDSRAQLLMQDLHELGFRHIAFVRSAALYRIRGELTRQQVEDISNKLLVDPITQLYTIRAGNAQTPVLLGAPSVEVWPKPGVTDMAGDSVSLAITDLGYHGIEQVRTGQKIHVSGHLSQTELEQLAKELLANILVNDYTVHYDDKSNYAKT